KNGVVNTLEEFGTKEKKFVAMIKEPLTNALRVYDLDSKFIDKESLNDHLRRQAVSTITSQFVVHFATSKLLSLSREGLESSYQEVKAPHSGKIGEVYKNGLYVAAFIIPFFVTKSVANNVDNCFSSALEGTLNQRLKEDLSSNETRLRIMHKKPDLLKNLDYDIMMMSGYGSRSLTSSVSNVVLGVNGFSVIMVYSKDIFTYLLFYNQMSAFLTKLFAERDHYYSEKIRNLSADHTAARVHDDERIDTIAASGGLMAIEERDIASSNEIKDLKKKQLLWNMLNQVCMSTNYYVSHVGDRLLIGQGIDNGAIPFAKRSDIAMGMDQLRRFLSLPAELEKDKLSFNTVLGDVTVLEGYIRESPALNEDQINRTTQEKRQLTLSNLEITRKSDEGKDVTIRIQDELNLDLGKVYVLTGKRGCGKTSLLSKIKGVKKNEVAGIGDIIYPRINGSDPKIVLAPQQEHFPLDYSLQQVLSYPDKISTDPQLNEKQRQEMSLLLTEINFAPFVEGKLKLDTKKNWENRVSGGEKRVLNMVSAIIKKPDILILDETFNSWPDEEIFNGQQLIKKYLPNALVIVVDHKARCNNFNGFYNQEIHVFEKTGVVLLRDIKPVDPDWDED
ncbi:MAG: ATP-binding cassette domain-containing protein, partial [Gammaproteobacteria bacterium]|nr:ATP-binding cassette domain-containing protein [Gammaproteobacteria bacterium]